MPRPTEPRLACRRRDLRTMRYIVWGWTWLVVTAPGWAEDVVVIRAETRPANRAARVRFWTTRARH